MKFKPAFIVFVVIVLILVGLILSNLLSPEKDIIEMEISGKTFFVEVADEVSERNRGLSGRESLGENEGMLFVFEYPTVPVFWMKDMGFPIDIVWISESKIIGWVPNALPEPGVQDENLSIYSPPQSVDMVLEFSAGTVSREGFRLGDSVLVQI
jgi:hypothetical protein